MRDWHRLRSSRCLSLLSCIVLQTGTGICSFETQDSPLPQHLALKPGPAYHMNAGWSRPNAEKVYADGATLLAQRQFRDEALCVETVRGPAKGPGLNPINRSSWVKRLRRCR